MRQLRGSLQRGGQQRGRGKAVKGQTKKEREKGEGVVRLVGACHNRANANKEETATALLPATVACEA